MARETEYLTSNRMIRYPFDDDVVLYSDHTAGSSSPSESSTSSESSPAILRVDDALALLVFGCFADASVSLKIPNRAFSPKITRIYCTRKTLYFSLTADDISCEDINISCGRSLDRFTVVTGTGSWCTYVFVIAAQGIADYWESKELIGDISQNRLSLSPRCIDAAAPAVTSLSVYGGEGGTFMPGTGVFVRYTREEAMLLPPDRVFASGKTVRLKYGYNTSISTDGNEITLSATPGAGAGTAPCGCTDAEVGFKTAGLLCADGHARLFNDLCYDLLPEKGSGSKNGYLSIHSKCKACCTCDMYASIVNNKLIPLRDKIRHGRNILRDALSLYEENVLKWNARIATALPEDVVTVPSAVPLTAAATDLSNKSNVQGKMDRCGFSLVMRNDSFVDLTFELDWFMSNGSPFEAQVGYVDKQGDAIVLPVSLSDGPSPEYSSSSDDPSSSSSEKGPIFSILLPPGRSATLTYFIRLNSLVKTDHPKGFLARLRISAYQEGKLITRKYEEMGL